MAHAWLADGGREVGSGYVPFEVGVATLIGAGRTMGTDGSSVSDAALVGGVIGTCVTESRMNSHGQASSREEIVRSVPAPAAGVACPE